VKELTIADCGMKRLSIADFRWSIEKLAAQKQRVGCAAPSQAWQTQAELEEEVWVHREMRIWENVEERTSLLDEARSTVLPKLSLGNTTDQ
jgi:hypothetical protein